MKDEIPGKELIEILFCSPKEPLKCEESEITETRDNYERCASNKIREITAWVERRQRKRRRRRRAEGQDEDDSILTVCNAVRQLLYDCGNELGWCFTEDQVSITSYLPFLILHIPDPSHS